MKKTWRIVYATTVWIYTLFVLGWFLLRTRFGDQIWWLALLNVFAPQMFTPLALLIPGNLAARRRALWGPLVIPMAIFVWFYGQLFLPAWPPGATSSSPMTIMSFNIWGGSRSPETAQVILENGAPDIVAIQELRPHMAELLLEEVGHLYPYHIFDTSSWRNGLGILSRYPLTALPNAHLYSASWEIQVVQARVQGRNITIYNIHPHSTNVLAFLRSRSAVARRIEISFQLREERIKRLLADLDTRTGPVLVVGDFNSTEQSQAYALLSSRLTDAHQAAGWGFGHTFPAYTARFRRLPLLPRQMRLDMIFYSQDFVALRSEVGRTSGESDHLPVTAHLAWREPRR